MLDVAFNPESIETYFDKCDTQEDDVLDSGTLSRLRILLSDLPKSTDGPHAAWLEDVHETRFTNERDTTTLDAVMKRHQGEVRVFVDGSPVWFRFVKIAVNRVWDTPSGPNILPRLMRRAIHRQRRPHLSITVDA